MLMEILKGSTHLKNSQTQNTMQKLDLLFRNCIANSYNGVTEENDR